MAGRGAAPKANSVTRHVPKRGEATQAVGVGWQHGKAPPAPTGLMPESRKAWSVWMRSWFAAHWTADDLPGLRQVIRLYDQVERGEYQRCTELRLQMDTYGMTPKGQQDRRWKQPEQEKPKSGRSRSGSSAYEHLRVVGDEGVGRS